MSNIHIPLEHQSSPKETELTRIVRKSAEEMEEGKWTPPLEETAFGAQEEFFDSGPLTKLAAHPRIQEAVSKLEYEVRHSTKDEYLEKAQQLHELNEYAARGEKWEGQERWMGEENVSRRMVNPMSPKAFIEKLQSVGIKAMLEPEIKEGLELDADNILQSTLKELPPPDAQVWLGRFVHRGVVGLYAWVEGEAKRVDKLQVPGGYEWTVVRFDEYNVPVGEKWHGWRTAVLGLIINRVITEAQAEKAFGKVVENEASSFYRQQIFEWRNGK